MGKWSTYQRRGGGPPHLFPAPIEGLQWTIGVVTSMTVDATRQPFPAGISQWRIRVTTLAGAVVTTGTFSSLVTVARGGLTPATEYILQAQWGVGGVAVSPWSVGIPFETNA